MLKEEEFHAFQAQMRKFVNNIPIAPVLWSEIKEKRKGLVSKQEFPRLKEILPARYDRLETYKIDINPKRDEDSNIDICHQCIRGIVNYVQDRRCFNMDTALKLNNVMQKHPQFCDASMVYVGEEFCKAEKQAGGTKLVKQFPTPNPDSYFVNEEHIVPVSVIKGYSDSNHHLVRDFHPFSTDFNYIYNTVASINEARSNFPVGEITQPRQISGYVRYDSSNHNTGAKAIRPRNQPKDHGTWNKVNEGKLPGAGYLGNPALGFGNHCFGVDDPENPSIFNFLLCRFEPIDADKGKIARAYLYYFCAYAAPYGNLIKHGALKRHVNYEIMNQFLNWDKKYYVTKEERDRALIISMYQDTVNPFVLLPFSESNKLLNPNELQGYLKQKGFVNKETDTYIKSKPRLFPQGKYTLSDLIFRGVPHTGHFPFH